MGFENGKLLRVAVTALHVSDGDRQVNTFHYDLKDDTLQPPNEPQTLADLFRDNVIPTYRAIYDNSWTIQPVVITEEIDPQNPTAARAQWTSGSELAGTHTVGGDALPRAMCGVVTLRTGSVGKRYRGRLFLGGSLGESDQSAGTWLTSINTLWNALVTAIPRQPDLATGVSTSTANWCVYSRRQRQENQDPYASAIESTFLRSQPHWLRTRQPF